MPPHPKRSLEKQKQWGVILIRALGVASRWVIGGAGDMLSQVIQPFRLLAIGSMQQQRRSSHARRRNDSVAGTLYNRHVALMHMGRHRVKVHS